MRLSDYPRSLNRARINALANGSPPYTDEEANLNKIAINVNDLSLTRLSHEARLQLYQAFNKPGNFFSAKLDAGPKHRRAEHSNTVTKEVTRVMKRSDRYFHCQCSKFAMTVLHGPGPSYWVDQDEWCPTPVEIGDFLVPGRTLTTFANLPFFAIYRAYSVRELSRVISRVEKGGSNPGWNLEVVRAALDWADDETRQTYAGTTWAEYWSPEKREARLKEDAGIYSGDQAQTVDCWDFYFWDDAGSEEGWRRRIVLDAEGGRGAWSNRKGKDMPGKNLLRSEEGQFLYNSNNRVVADKLSKIVHCQFADLSAVAPFKYHSVRSLGFMLYAVCHLQNRLRCKFGEAVFETLMPLLRVRSLDDVERALKIELVSRGFLDESVQFVPPAERWQPDYNLVRLGMSEYAQVIRDNSASYVQNQNWSQDRVEKTKFQVMAEVTAMQTLQTSAQLQTARRQLGEYLEIFRRLMQKDSRDPDVNEFRARCLARGVPEQFMVPDCWDLEVERVFGGGNKAMELAIAQQLMEWRPAYPPEAQTKILRDATIAITDDAARSTDLVPFAPQVSDDAHQAALAFGAMMVGAKIAFTASQNRIEIVNVLLAELGLQIQQVNMEGGMTTPDKVAGMENVLAHVATLIGEIAGDPAQRELARSLADTSGEMANAVKGFRQRVDEALEAQQEQAGGDGEMAKTMAKIESDRAISAAKMQERETAHAQRTAQREVQWESEQRRRAAEQEQKLRFDAQDKALDLAAKAGKVALDQRQPSLDKL